MDLDEPSTQWLNLSCYDQKEENFIAFQKENEEVWARCLLKVGEKTKCVRGVVLAWVADKGKYKFKFTHDGVTKGALVPKIFLCCDL